jgi:F-type H+-transporting ATPase subunit epsilon
MRGQDVILLKVLTPENIICEKMVSKVSLPGALGRFMVLKDHAPLISSLEAGDIVFESNGTEGKIPVVNGFVEIAFNKIIVCAEV